MAIQLGSAYGKVNIDSTGVKTGVGSAITSLENLGRVGTLVGDAIKKAGQAMTIGLTLPILAIGTASVKAASDLDETRNKVKVVFGDMSDDVLEWGKSAATAFGQSQQQALEAAGTFGNLFTSMGLGKSESADMSKGLVQLAADLASFNNIDPALVLEKLRSGLVGEVEPLRTLGINLTMAQVKAKAMEMGLANASGEVSQAALVQARYALILEQSTNAQGDFARTSDGLANSTRIMKAQFQDALATLGVNLLPTILKVVQGINKMLEAFNNAPPFVQKAVLGFMLFLAVLGPILSVLGTVISGLSGLVSLVGGLGVSMATVSAVASTAGSMLLAFGGAALSALGSILLLAAGPVLLYVAFKNNFMGITTTVKQLWEIIKYYFKQITTNIANSFKNINWGQIGRNMIMGIASGISSSISTIVSAAANAGRAALEAMRNALDSHSPSRKFMKLGIDSGDGYKLGLQNSVNPNVIAKAMAKPVQQVTSQQSTRNTIHMASGLTLRDLDEMMNRKLDKFTLQLNDALGGA